MFAITAQNVIVFANRGDRADCDRFLADVKMAEAANFAGDVNLGRFLFEAPDQNHLPVKLDELARFEAAQAVLLTLFGLVSLLSQLLFIDVFGWIDYAG